MPSCASSLIGWLAQSFAVLLVAQVLHAATFGAFHAASIGYVHRIFRGRLQARGQAIYGSFSFGVGGALGGLASGYVWEHAGAALAFTLGAAVRRSAGCFSRRIAPATRPSQLAERRASALFGERGRRATMR